MAVEIRKLEEAIEQSSNRAIEGSAWRIGIKVKFIERIRQGRQERRRVIGKNKERGLKSVDRSD
jgi:hypothetical protein